MFFLLLPCFVFSRVRQLEVKLLLATLLASLAIDFVAVSTFSNLHIDPLTSRLRILPGRAPALAAAAAPASAAPAACSSQSATPRRVCVRRDTGELEAAFTSELSGSAMAATSSQWAQKGLTADEELRKVLHSTAQRVIAVAQRHIALPPGSNASRLTLQAWRLANLILILILILCLILCLILSLTLRVLTLCRRT